MSTPNKQDAARANAAAEVATYQNNYAKCLEYFERLSVSELLIYHLFWTQRLFPDEIAARMGLSCDDVVREIVDVARKLAPIVDLL